MESWASIFKDCENELNDIWNIIDNKEKYYPNKEDIFKCFELVKLENVKVIILDKEPYNNNYKFNDIILSKATGLAYSIRKNDNYIPKSITNIHKELKRSISEFIIPPHGNLENWCKQGVLLLNTCLTVVYNKPDSHKFIWYSFINKIFKGIEKINPKCIVLSWGIKKIRGIIPNNFIVYETCSPYLDSFIGCNHFNIVNENLDKYNKTIEKKYKLDNIIIDENKLLNKLNNLNLIKNERTLEFNEIKKLNKLTLDYKLLIVKKDLILNKIKEESKELINWNLI